MLVKDLKVVLYQKEENKCIHVLIWLEDKQQFGQSGFFLLANPIVI